MPISVFALGLSFLALAVLVTGAILLKLCSRYVGRDKDSATMVTFFFSVVNEAYKDGIGKFTKNASFSTPLRELILYVPQIPLGQLHRLRPYCRVRFVDRLL